jgi:hypothetical protein
VVNTYLLYVRFQAMRGQLSAEAAREEMRLVRASLSAKIGQPGELLEGNHWSRFLDAWTTDF